MGFRDPPFAQLAAYLPAELLPRALAVAVELKDGIYRRSALRSVVPLLPPYLAVEALASARGLTDPTYRAQTLLDLAPRLPPPARPAALADAYAAITRIDPADEARLWAVGTLIAQLTDSPAAAPPAFDALPSEPWDRGGGVDLCRAAGLCRETRHGRTAGARGGAPHRGPADPRPDADGDRGARTGR